MTNQDLQRFIACLSTTPVLRSLNLSHNSCSFATVQKLREQIESRALKALRQLHCVAITADEVAMGYLLAVFQITPPCCPDLQVVDVSGNPLNNPKAATQLARVFTSNVQLSSCWPELTTLNISSTNTALLFTLGINMKLSLNAAFDIFLVSRYATWPRGPSDHSNCYSTRPSNADSVLGYLRQRYPIVYRYFCSCASSEQAATSPFIGTSR